MARGRARIGPAAAEATKAVVAEPTSAPPIRPLMPGNQALLRLQRKCSCGGTCANCKKAALRDPEKPRVQTKVPVGPVNDPLERDADAVAERVMRMPATEDAFATSTVQPGIQRKCDDCADPEEDQGVIRRKVSEGEKSEGTNGTTSLTASNLTQGGSPLPGSVREFFEPRFGHDFSDVRVHTGAEAERANLGLSSNAFAYGKHIWVGSGQSVDTTPLLAHELTHVVQQTAPSANPSIQRDPTTDRELTKSSDKKPGSKCTTDAQPGAAKAYPDNHAEGPSGSYVMWGPMYKGESVTDYCNAGIAAWIPWRFGTVSAAVSQRIRIEAARNGWVWRPHQPDLNCQATVSISMDLMNRLVSLGDADKGTLKTDKKESDAGLAALPPPAPVFDDMWVTEVTASKDPTQPDPPSPPPRLVTQREQAEEALDPTVTYNKGANGANSPPFPARMEGPEMEVPNGTGAYTMILDYEAVTSDPLIQMAYHLNAVSYHWELFNVTNLVKSGLSMGSSMVQEAKRTQEISQDLEMNKDAADAAQGATGQRAANAVDELSEQTEQTLRELRHPVKAVAGGSAIDVVTRGWANILNLELLPASAITAAGGWLIGSIPDLFGDYSKEKEIAFPAQQGYYMLRCIAQPFPRGPKQSEIRAASVRSKIVEVRSPEILAENALGMPEASIANLNVQKMMTSDAAEIARIDAQIARVRESTSGDIVGYLRKLVKEKEAEKAGAPSWRQYDLERELKTLNLRLSQAEEKRTGTIGDHIRPQAAFVSKITGQTYPLMLEVTEMAADSGKKVRLFDVTFPDRKPVDTTGDSFEAAVDNAFTLFSHNGDLGPGTLFVRMPQGWKGKALLTYPVVASGGAAVKRRLEDLATVLLLLSVVVPGVGEVSMAIAAALAAERLISRALNNSLRLDAESVSDTLAILGAVAQGAQLVGKLRIASKGDAFVAALRTSEQATIEAAAEALSAAKKVGKILDATSTVVNAGGLIWGDLVLVNQFAEIAKQEMDGKISHADASRQRANMLAGAIRDHGIMLSGVLKPQGADKASGTETPKTEAPPAKTEAPPAGEGNRGGPAEKPAETGPAKAADKAPGADQTAPSDSVSKPPETIPEGELEKRANEPAVAAGTPATAADKKNGVRSRFNTPDNLHQIFILEDGRIFRCSLSCGELRSWYGPYLDAQPEGSRRQRATDLEGALSALEARVKARETGAKLDQEIGALDQAMREFIAPDLARSLQQGSEARGIVQSGETFLATDQVRELLKFFNLDEIGRIAGPDGLPTAKAVRDLVGLMGALDAAMPPGDRMRIHEMLGKLAEGGDSAATALDFLNRVAKVYGVTVQFDMAQVRSAKPKSKGRRGKTGSDDGPQVRQEAPPEDTQQIKAPKVKGADIDQQQGVGSQVGNWAHANFEKLAGFMPQANKLISKQLKPNLEPEHRIPNPSYAPGREPRIDRLDRPGKTVIEIKPHSLAADGLAEAKAYAQEMDRFESLVPGERWAAECVTYDFELVMTYMEMIGVLTHEEVAAFRKKQGN